MKRSQLSPVFLVLAGLARLACAAPPADSGALDATFGSGGKVQLAPAPEIGIASHALDIAVQSDGKTLVAGYDTYNGSCSGGTPCVGETWRITERVERLNALGFDIDEMSMVTTADGTAVRIQPKVVDAGHHQRRLIRLTGLDVEENQARRLLNDLDEPVVKAAE